MNTVAPEGPMRYTEEAKIAVHFLTERETMAARRSEARLYVVRAAGREAPHYSVLSVLSWLYCLSSLMLLCPQPAERTTA